MMNNIEVLVKVMLQNIQEKKPNKQIKKKNSPSMNTGIKAPDGTGMVVATADIQNCKTRNRRS